MKISVFASFALTILCASANLFFPDTVPLLERRQAPGTPAYDCHANCGAVISAARGPDYCSSSNFTTALTACLNCANQFDIWRYYSAAVQRAASACNLPAVPANSTSSANTTASATASASGSAGSASGQASSASSTASASAAATSRSAAMKNILDLSVVSVVVAGLAWAAQI